MNYSDYYNSFWCYGNNNKLIILHLHFCYIFLASRSFSTSIDSLGKMTDYVTPTFCYIFLTSNFSTSRVDSLRRSSPLKSKNTVEEGSNLLRHFRRFVSDEETF